MKGYFVVPAAGLAVAIVLAAGPSSQAATPVVASATDSAAVAAVVARYHDALSVGDSTTALSLLTSDAVVLESGGMETRAEYRSHHLASDIDFARTVKSIRSPVKVNVNGSTAWTSSTSTTQGEFKGRAINTMGAESMVLTRGAEGWRIRAIHWSSRNRK